MKTLEYGHKFTAEELLDGIYEQGADPYLIEDLELAEQVAESINNSEDGLDVILPGDDEYDVASRKLGGTCTGPIYTFVDGCGGTFVLSGDWELANNNANRL